MKKLTLLLFPILMLMGCTTNYYLITSNQPTEIYNSNGGDEVVTVIPSGNNYITVGKSSKRFTQWGSFSGYSRKPQRVIKETKLSAAEYANLVYITGLGYVHKEYASTLGSSRSTSTSTTSSGSTRSSGTSTKTTSSSGGTVHVKGYTRKDGTYVRPHTRSAPKRH